MAGKDYAGKSKYTIAIAVLILVLALVGYYLLSGIKNSIPNFTKGEEVAQVELSVLSDFDNFSGVNPEDITEETPVTSKVNIGYYVDITDYNDSVVISFPIFEEETGIQVHKYYDYNWFGNTNTFTNRYYVFKKVDGKLLLTKMINAEDWFNFILINEKAYHSKSVEVDLTSNDIKLLPYTQIEDEVVNYFADETQNLSYGQVINTKNYERSGTVTKYLDCNSLSGIKANNRIVMNNECSLEDITSYFSALVGAGNRSGSGKYTGYAKNMFKVYNVASGAEVTDGVNLFAYLHYNNVSENLLEVKDKNLGDKLSVWDNQSKYIIPDDFKGIYVTTSQNTNPLSTGVTTTVTLNVVDLNTQTNNEETEEPGDNPGTGGGQTF